MSDRTQARAYGDAFKIMADHYHDLSDKSAIFSMALDLLKKAKQGDFLLYQMECDDALISLGLAKVKMTEDGIETEVIYR